MATGVEETDVEGKLGGGSGARTRAWLWVAVAVAILLVAWLLARDLIGTRDKGGVQSITTSTIEVPPRARLPAVPEPGPVFAVNQADASAIPDVVGKTEESGTSILENAGYRTTVLDVFSVSAQVGSIISQTPAAGAPAAAGDTVSLVVSKGRRIIVQVTMPSVEGLTRKAAEAKIRAAGLRPYVMYGVDAQRIGRVISQWPNPGTSVPAGNEGFIQISLK